MKILKLHDSYGGSPLYVVAEKITTLSESIGRRADGKPDELYPVTHISLDCGSAAVRESVSQVIDMMEAGQ